MTSEGKKLRDALLTWSEKHPPLFAAFAMEVASSSEVLLKSVEWAVEESPVRGLVGRYDEDAVWSFYEDPLALRNALIVASTGEDAPNLLRAADSFDKLPRFAPRYARLMLRDVTIDQLRDGYRRARRWANVMLRKQANRIVRGDDPLPDRIDAEALVRSPLGGFFLGVAVPSWILTGSWPRQHFAATTKKPELKLSALLKLVQFDSRVLHHPLIREGLHCGSFMHRRAREQAVGQAFGVPPKRFRHAGS